MDLHIESRTPGLQEGHVDLIHCRMTTLQNPHRKKDRKVAEALVAATLPRGPTNTARKKKPFKKPFERPSFQWKTS